jgi:hypothetical protein
MSEGLKDVDLTKAPDPTEEPEEEKKEEVEGEEEPKDAGEALDAFEGGPNKDQLEDWKQQFGEVLVSGFSATELFVFRPLSRGEFTNLQAHLAQTEGVSQLDVEEKICDACVLWASEKALASLTTKAGTLTTLHEQIMQASNFMDPRYAGSFVVRL